MSKGKTLILSNYLCLFVWWIVLAFTNSKDGLGNAFYLFGIGAYAFILGLSLANAARAYPVLTKQKMSVVIISLGMAFFGLGTLIWFYNDFFGGIDVPFPSVSDVFYVAQFPISVFGIMCFLTDGVSKRLRNYFGLAAKTLIFVFAIFVFAYIAAKVFSGYVDLGMYLLYYYSFESLSILILYMFCYRVANSSGSVSSFVYVLLGQALWFIADGFFFYGIVTGTLYDANYSDLLYLTGVFFVLFGLTSMIEKSKDEGFLSPVGPVYFQKVALYNAIELHLRRFVSRLALRRHN
ncbi:hypothetical protein HYW61_01405 [candidate division WWE3 bacterium]|nr:hypothetical protein [candidate division WWE3 bacterium]